MFQIPIDNKKDSFISGQGNTSGTPFNVADSIKVEDNSLARIDEFIEHYGIPGMKWGVRRYRGSDGKVLPNKFMPPEKAAALRKSGGSTPTSPTAISSSEHQQARELRQIPVSQMTNQQIQSYLQRMNLERNYKEVAAKDVSSGRKFVNALMKEVGNIGKDLVRDIAKNKIRDIAAEQGLLPKSKKKGGS